MDILCNRIFSKRMKSSHNTSVTELHENTDSLTRSDFLINITENSGIKNYEEIRNKFNNKK